jgi:hypothetical protein
MLNLWRTVVLCFVVNLLCAGAAFAQAKFYVDPDYGSGNETPNGTVMSPWVRLGASEWAAINSRLDVEDVVVYFSSKEAGTAASEVYGGELVVQRTNTSSHRLTLDGMTKYNINDVSPSAGTWLDTAGNYRLRLAGGGSGLALGWHSGHGKRNNITLRGFEASGPHARVVFGGDNIIVEHIHVHDVTGNGPGMLLMYAPFDDGQCRLMGVFRNIVVRNNTIERTLGEGLYLGGTDNCPALGNTHDGILVENNTINHPGINGGQGDGIDIKDGLSNVTVRGNRISDTHLGSGITVAGGYGSERQGIIIEHNQIYRSAQRGILVGSNWGDPRGYIIRYNTIVNSSSAGVSLSGGATSSIDVYDIAIHCNTIAGNGGEGVSGSYTDHLSVLNNLVFDNNPSSPNFQITVDTAIRNSGTAVNDYNLYSTGSAQANANAIAGPNNQIRTSSAGLTVDPQNPGWGACGRPAAPTGVRIVGTLAQ